MAWILRKKVLPQHTDHAGVMWHGAYLNWLEESRVDALGKSGVSYADLAASGYEMPVVNLNIKYLSSLHHGNEVTLQSFLLPQQGIKFSWQTNFLKTDGSSSAQAIVDLVLVRKIENNFRAVRRLPDNLREAFSNLRKGSSY